MYDRAKNKPTPKAIGYCPECGQPLTAKCGRIKAWHWAHRPDAQCDYASEETDWHRGWKSEFPFEQVEVKVGNHRADIKTPHYVIELQHSPISVDEIEAREAEYGDDMLWIFDARGWWVEIVSVDDDRCRFKWRPRSYVRYCNRCVYFDLGEAFLLRVEGLDGREGRGYLCDRSRFLSQLQDGTLTGRPLQSVGNCFRHCIHATEADHTADAKRYVEAVYGVKVNRVIRWPIDGELIDYTDYQCM